MTVEKGLDEDVADKIGKWVVHSGKRDLLERMQKDEELSANPRMQEGLADIDLLFTYLENFDAMDSVSFDLSLARGLDCKDIVACLSVAAL
jgi:histidyl-tRNA synthetase